MKELSLGELLVRKAEAGVKVLMLVWSDISDQMGTHDNQTEDFFRGKHRQINSAPPTSHLQAPESSAAKFLEESLSENCQTFSTPQ